MAEDLKKSGTEAVPQITETNVIQLQEDFRKVKGDIGKAQDDLQDIKRSVKEDINRVNNWVLFAVLFFAATFAVAIVSIYWDGILSNKSDRELYLKYDDIFKNYSDQTFELKDKIFEQEIEVNKLRNELEILRVKNYLK